MIKLYLKKTLLIIVFFLFILGIYFIGYSVLGFLSSFFKHTAIRYSILMGIPTLIALRLVYKCRVKDQNLKIDYVNHIRSSDATDRKINIKNEINYFKTFKPLIAEISAVATIMLPIFIAIGFSLKNEASFFVNFLAGIIVFAFVVTIYAVLDAAFWMLVHKQWLGDALWSGEKHGE